MGWVYDLSHNAAKLGVENPLVFYVCQELGNLDTLKTAPFVAALVALWFGNKAGDRQIVIGGIVGTFVALIVSRFIQNFGPYTPRPAHLPQMPFLNSYSAPPDWSSFPSDTAACLAALATAIWIASRSLGLVAVCYAIVVLITTKLIVGAHFASDLLVGMLIGSASTYLCYRFYRRFESQFTGLNALAKRNPALLAGITFLFLVQLATFFDDIRRGGRGVFHLTGIVREVSAPQIP